ncbi:hypothetical protein [Psychroflexus lacisalsi]|jgi:hypothetical protein|uniref:Arginyl-tRNA synthetase n=1 Tax=Psychroflexus lacisalsi TaxID=503928 RepID=A0ABP3VKG5_9FLAO|nr:hypothetical protein [Psychroflexus lacisalsi]MBZ9620668.1 hypothetical protein [Psychroflexus lacisalsi]
MLLNVSYNRPKIKQQIIDKVGKPFTFMERIKLGGIGSGKLNINSSSIQIYNLLILDNNLNICGVEMRPNGIIVTFRSLLETYALVIPYYKLKLYKGQSKVYSIYMDNYFIKVEAKEKRNHEFLKKILKYKSDNFSNDFENY